MEPSTLLPLLLLIVTTLNLITDKQKMAALVKWLNQWGAWCEKQYSFSLVNGVSFSFSFIGVLIAGLYTGAIALTVLCSILGITTAVIHLIDFQPWQAGFSLTGWFFYGVSWFFFPLSANNGPKRVTRGLILLQVLAVGILVAAKYTV